MRLPHELDKAQISASTLKGNSVYLHGGFVALLLTPFHAQSLSPFERPVALGFLSS